MCTTWPFVFAYSELLCTLQFLTFRREVVLCITCDDVLKYSENGLCRQVAL